MRRVRHWLNWYWRSLTSTRCRHLNTVGFANHYDAKNRKTLQALQCEDCTMVIIEEIV